MPNPTTNPTRLSRTTREVAWNPLPGDAVRLPGGYLTTMSSAPNAQERFLKALAQAPAGSTIRPYDGLPQVGSYTGTEIVRFLVSRNMGALRALHVHLPEILDRWLGSGGALDVGLLDFTADLPEAPFVHHAANILHCMVKFGAPAFVAAKPARDPRNNPQPGDTKTIHWVDSRSTLYYDARDRHEWPVHMGVKTTWACGERDPRNNPQPGDRRISSAAGTWVWSDKDHSASRFHVLDWSFKPRFGDVRWECGDAPAKAPEKPAPTKPTPGPHSWMYAFQNPYFAKYGPWPVVSGPPEGRVTDLSDFTREFLAGRARPLGPNVHAVVEDLVRVERRCPRTDPRPGDVCMRPGCPPYTAPWVDTFRAGDSVHAWRSGLAGALWVRAEDIVGLPK